MGLGLGITIFLTTESIDFLAPRVSRAPGGRETETDSCRLRSRLFGSHRQLVSSFLGPVIAEVLIVSCLILAIFAAKGRVPESVS